MENSLQILKNIKIFGLEDNYNLQLRSFIAKNNIVYFRTVIAIDGTDSFVLDTQPIPSWLKAKGIYNDILKNIKKHISLNKEEVIRLSKENGIK